MTSADRETNTDLAFKLVLFAAIAALTVFLAYQLKILIVVIILAVTMASAMAPLAEAGERKKIPRFPTVLALYVIGIVCYGTLAALLAPALHEQWNKLNDNLPSSLSSLNSWYQSALNIAGTNTDALIPSIENIRDLGIRFLHQTLDMTAGFVGLVLNTILTLFLAGYFVVEANKIWASIFNLLPLQSKARMRALILPLASRMGGYVRGQLLVALCTAVFFATGFSLLGIRYALVLGMLAGLLNLVPYIGSFCACTLSVIIAFNQSVMLAGATLLLYAVEQWFESTVMVPFFVGKQASLHPLIVLLAIIFGASVMGIPGALVSVPLASAIVYLIEECLVNRSAKRRNSATPDGKPEVSTSVHEPNVL